MRETLLDDSIENKKRSSRIPTEVERLDEWSVPKSHGTETLRGIGAFSGGVWGVMLPVIRDPKPTSETSAVMVDGSFKLLNKSGAYALWTESQLACFCHENRDKLIEMGGASFSLGKVAEERRGLSEGRYMEEIKDFVAVVSVNDKKELMVNIRRRPS